MAITNGPPSYRSSEILHSGGSCGHSNASSELRLTADGKSEAVFNFPLHKKHRDGFLRAVGEVVAAHAFSEQYLGLPPGELPAGVIQGVLGSVTRLRAARGLG